MADTGTALSVQAPRTYLNVEEPIHVLDTARFEQMQRVAQVMAYSAFTPECFRGFYSGTKDRPVWNDYPPQIILANCFMIVEQAVRWNMSPFAVAPCCSLVHNQLMFEGKLVYAVVQARLRISLDYQWGKWDPKTETCIVGPEGEGDALAVRVFDPETGRDVHGSVGVWKTTGANSPWRPGAMKRQCRYRGSREWSRAHEPSIMLGVITDDEIIELTTRRFRDDSPVAPGLIERLEARGDASGPGFQATNGQGGSEDAPRRAEPTSTDTPPPKTDSTKAAAKVKAADVTVENGNVVEIRPDAKADAETERRAAEETVVGGLEEALAQAEDLGAVKALIEPTMEAAPEAGQFALACLAAYDRVLELGEEGKNRSDLTVFRCWLFHVQRVQLPKVEAKKVIRSLIMSDAYKALPFDDGVALLDMANAVVEKLPEPKSKEAT